ncbi:MAG: hypothetical protein EB027_00760 [Actinobacteria bacterium]|nr:hypothetical protein [Actinomycetota bacterium]
MKRSLVAAFAAISAVAVTTPVAAYPPPDSVDVFVDKRVMAARSSFDVTVTGIKPEAKCSIIFNKKTTRCDVDGAPYRFETTLTAPSTRGKFRVVVSVPADGEYGRSDSTFVYIPYIRVPATAKVGRDFVAKLSYLPQDTEVTLTVNGDTQASDFANEDGAVSGLTWSPASKGSQVVRIYADGDLFFTRTYKVR